MSWKLNRLRGRVFGWFDVKSHRDWVQPKARLEMAALEDRVTPSFTPYQVPTQYVSDGGSGRLTVPSQATPLEIATTYLNANAREFGLSMADLANMKVTSQYTDEPTGTSHVYLRQTVNGLEVNGADFNVTIDRNGSVFSVGGGFVPGLAAMLAGENASVPAMMPHEAVAYSISALSTLDIDDHGHGETEAESHSDSEPKLRDAMAAPQTYIASNTQTRDSWVASEFSLEPIPARLHYVPTADGSAVLAWNLNIQTADYAHWYDLSIDARTGELRHLADWIAHAGYQVVPAPNEHPNDGGFAILADPQIAAASPFGWHDTNGVAGPEFTDTRGNNVDAHLDRDNNNSADASPPRPAGTSTLNFSNYSFDPATDPLITQNQNAAMVNLFYMNNWIHDITYQYGFTPVAGNFQTNNYGLGGLGNDAVQADAQDGSGTNNANFGTPVDGQAPRMQMFIWTAATPDRDSDFDNGVIIHEYTHGISNRLTGGPGNVSALNATQSGGMGEGWGDFYGIMLSQRPTDSKTTSHPIGNYLNLDPDGIRAYPYSFNMTTNPIMWDSYGTSGTTSYGLARSTAVHRTGTIWASTLWDLNMLLIDKYGYDSDMSTGWSAVPGSAGNAGNKLVMQLVMDGMKQQLALPSFTDARQGILDADTLLTGGANHLQIWQAFARRGLGEGAAIVASSSTATIVNNTVVPAAVQTLQVTSHTPADQAILATAPTSFTLNFTDVLDGSTVSAADFTVNGIAATGVNYTPGSTVATFTFATTPVTAQGLQLMEMAAGAVTRLSDGGGVQAFAAGFRYDSLKLTVSSSTPASGSSQAPPLTTFDLNLNEAVDPATVSTFDLVLSQGYATAVAFLNGNTTIRYTLTGLNVESALTAKVNAGAFADINGNGNAAFTGTYQIDYATRAFTPLIAIAPLGSAVYEGSMTGLVNTGTDEDEFTIALDAGQTFTTLLTPASSLRPQVTILSPTMAVLTTISAASNGTRVTTAPVTTTVAGTYTIRVQSVAGTSGTFTLEPTLNAVIEAESAGTTTNHTAATAESLATAFVTTATGAGSTSRATVLGGTDLSTIYTAAPVAYAFENIAATGTTILANSDDVSTSFNIPFSFNFYGTNYTTLFVSDNGLITFGSGTTVNTNGNLATSPSQATIAVMWEDLVTNAAGVKWQVLGSAGSRRVVVQWETAKYFVSSGTSNNTLQFQAILYEGSNQIRFNYAQLSGGVAGDDEGASATIGIKNATSTSTLLLAQNVAGSIYHGTGKSTLITPPSATPDYYSFTATAGQTVSLAVHGLTAGTLDLTLVASDGSTVLATGATGPTNFTEGIANFVIPAAGTYYAAVIGGTSVVPYSLSVLTGAADAEANDTAATAEALGASRTAAGYLAASNDDWYTFTLPVGTNAVTVETATPGDGVGEFTNTLNPLLRVYDATGTTLLASGVALPDGRNETLTLTALTAGTNYAIRMTPTGATVGEYIFALQPFNAAPNVTDVVINDGATQRSRILTLAVEFSDAVTIAPGAFSITNGTATLTDLPGGGLLTAASIVSGATVATLTLDSAIFGVVNRSLADGIWTLTVNAASVTGTTTGLPMAANHVEGGIARLLGDGDGSGTIDGNDLSLFGNDFNTVLVAFDFNDDGVVDGSDLTVFGNHFGSTL